jgi:SAM-dependent methyltransferase
MDDLEALYDRRFTSEDLAWKRSVWRVLCRRVFQQYVPADATVVDLGAGACEFINAITARRRIAVDLNPAVARNAAVGVESHVADASRLSFLPDRCVDVVFSSNFLEHLPSKDHVMSVLREAARVLSSAGRIILMGPNARIVQGSYWDFFDHHVPLTERSLAEALAVVGFAVERVQPRFLPYTSKNALPRVEALVHAFLSLQPLSGWLAGGQFLIVARRAEVDPIARAGGGS